MQAELANSLTGEEIAEGLQDALRLFEYEALSPEQEKLITTSIEGRDVLGVLPTGGGKSACFQIPGIVTRSKTLVISPLIALQEDQVRRLRKLGIKAFCLHSGLTDARKMAVYYYFKNPPPGEASFLYLSPELLLTEAFHERFDGVRFDRIAVDEAHCVSTWGDAFRPDYQRIRVAVQRLRIPHCAAFTATVDPKIERDIRRRIPIRPGFLKVAADPMRPNLTFAVTRPASVEDHTTLMGRRKFNRLLSLLSKEEYAGPTIVYCSSRDATVNLWSRVQKGRDYWFCREKGYTSYVFHAGLPYEDKELALEGFLNDPKPLIFATSAFGMGIDRADVRQVIHYHVPQTLIDYAQQVGRAGRDGKPSLCTTFHLLGETFEARTTKSRWDVPTYDFVEMIHRKLRVVLGKYDQKERRRYNIRTFANHMRIRVEASKTITWKNQYLNRVNSSLAMLQRVGVIRESGDGLVVFDITPGSKPHLDLIAMTEMEARKLIREADRLVRFFDSPSPDQNLLWEIIRTDEYPVQEKEEEHET
jgi:RecQ family ATP-dependent DNA helicase